MPLVTYTNLTDAERDLSDLGKIVGGSATLANPGQATGTVTTRLGAIVKTLAKVAADGGTLITTLFTPKVYNTSAARTAALGSVSLGQLAYDRETTQMYMAVDEDGTGVLPREWVIVSETSAATAAILEELYAKTSATGRTSVNDAVFLDQLDYCFEQNAIQRRYFKWPGKSTTSEGLALALNHSTWPTNRYGQYAVDYGLTTNEGDLDDWTTHPDYELANTRIKVINGSADIVENLNIQGGYIDVNATVTVPIYIQECLIDTQYNKLGGVVQNNFALPVYIRHCTIKNFLNEAVNLRRGHIVNCDISLSQGDGLKADGDTILIDNNMVRQLGQVNPSAHGDALQIQDTNNLTVIRNTFYMPGTGTTYDEATNGSTQMIRLITENAAYSITDVVIAGNLLIGGGYALAIRSKFAGNLVENIIIVNNVFGNSDYFVYGNMTDEHHLANNPGTIRNLILYNNIDIDGQPIKYAGTDQNGVWHFNKDYANDRFLEIGKRIGVLDWNGDLASGVTSRSS